jgi:hypothetical protein
VIRPAWLLTILLVDAAFAPAASPDAAEPVLHAWIRSRSSGPAAVIEPEVHQVTISEDAVEVRSAGLSLVYLGPFQSPPLPGNRVRQFVFRIPRHPVPANGRHEMVPPEMSGVFVNGVPVYNLFEADSYQGQNLWHFDPIAAGVRNGHGNSLGAIEQLLADSGRHSPIIGFAFDGYPIYGPWGFANANGSGGLTRMRSSYRLRRAGDRTSWADGTRLTPGQYGPAVSAEFPAGTFTEDYEYLPGAGDLDEFNGRMAVTPEYPQGTYAYFLSTDAAARPAFPYLLAGRYFGRVDGQKPPAGTCRGSICLHAAAEPITADSPAHFAFTVRDAAGHPVRSLEYVHEKPVHLIVVSADLAEFDHLHPQLAGDGRFELAHRFRSGGHYRLYAEFTAPGAPARHESFDVNVAGPARAQVPLKPGPTSSLLRTSDPLRAGKDIELRFAVPDRAGLEPYLGAWAHVVILDEKQRHFIHAHPTEDGPVAVTPVHAHSGAVPAGPAPAEIRVMTSFPEPGVYKLWLQMQRRGTVEAISFVVQVGEAEKTPAPQVEIPQDAIRIRVSASGFQPARVELPAGRSLNLAFERSAEPNCASRVAIPSLGITQDLPLGGVTLVQLPPQTAGELRFGCGMGMYKGMLVIDAE